MARITTLSSVFDLIGGLPVHPLAVHVAVVLVPLAALALVALVFLPKQRSTFLPTVTTVAALGAIATFVAKESGDALSERIGLPQTHADLGEIMFPASVGLTLIAVAFWVLSKSQRPAWQLRSAMTASVIAALGVSGLSFLVGHSGAEATWANRVAIVASAPAQTGAQTQLTGDEISVEELSKHDSAADCWSVVGGKVYDLTSYVNSHPGGSGAISALCGKDATQAFSGQHGGASSPTNILASFLVGTLAADTQAASSLPQAPAVEYEEDEGDEGEDEEH